MNLLKKLALPAMLLTSLIMTGCGTTQSGSSADSMPTAEAEKTAEAPAMESEGMNFELNADSDSDKAGMLKTVYYPFNSSQLTMATREMLDANAEFLKSNTALEIQIEGHCDERGGIQYNLALGEKRAKAAKDYLVALGVEERRISTISFGKERPLSFGHDEMSWSKNRRANFVITAK